jgi:SsrA-binding protein
MGKPGKKKKTKDEGPLYAAQNRRARFDYTILEDWHAGIVLTGSEVKSLRSGKANIGDSFAEVTDGELWLVNAYIPEYTKAGMRNHETRRSRKLLLHKSEIRKLIGKLKKSGLTVVALSIYFNKKGLAKVHIALAQGKTKYDKRETEKRREWEREKGRMLRQ